MTIAEEAKKLRGESAALRLQSDRDTDYSAAAATAERILLDPVSDTPNLENLSRCFLALLRGHRG